MALGTPWLLSALVALPMAGALALSLLPRPASRLAARLCVVLAAAESLLALRVWLAFDAADGLPQLVQHHLWVPRFGIAYHLAVDGLSLGLVMLTALLPPLALAFAWPRLAGRQTLFAASVWLLQGALMGAFLARDLLLFYVFWELTLLPSTLLVAVFGSTQRLLAARTFFLTTLAGSLVMLAALLFTAATYHQLSGVYSFDLDELRRIAWPEHTQTWLFVAFLLAFAIKLPIFPLHAWLPLTYTEASTGTALLFTALLSKLGAYGLLRIATPLFPVGSYLLGPSVAALAVFGMVYAGFAAWAHASGEGQGAARGDMQRFWAYVSLAHLGFLPLGLLSLDENGVGGAVLHMVGHGIASAAAFMLLGWLSERAGDRRIGSLSGIAGAMPVFATAFFLVALSALGLPGTSGFVGEFLILLGAAGSLALDPWGVWLVIGAGLGIVVAAVYSLQLVRRTLWGPPPAEAEARGALVDLKGREAWLVAPLVIGIFWLGLAPTLLLSRIQPSVRLHLEDQRSRLRLVPAEAPQLGAKRLAPSVAIPEAGR